MNRGLIGSSHSMGKSFCLLLITSSLVWMELVPLVINLLSPTRKGKERYTQNERSEGRLKSIVPPQQKTLGIRSLFRSQNDSVRHLDSLSYL